jgi:hypothetical protein
LTLFVWEDQTKKNSSELTSILVMPKMDVVKVDEVTGKESEITPVSEII